VVVVGVTVVVGVARQRGLTMRRSSVGVAWKDVFDNDETCTDRDEVDEQERLTTAAKSISAKVNPVMSGKGEPTGVGELDLFKVVDASDVLGCPVGTTGPRLSSATHLFSTLLFLACGAAIALPAPSIIMKPRRESCHASSSPSLTSSSPTLLDSDAAVRIRPSSSSATATFLRSHRCIFALLC
jgi:hypothetical protein